MSDGGNTGKGMETSGAGAADKVVAIECSWQIFKWAVRRLVRLAPKAAQKKCNSGRFLNGWYGDW